MCLNILRMQEIVIIIIIIIIIIIYYYYSSADAYKFTKLDIIVLYMFLFLLAWLL